MRGNAERLTPGDLGQQSRHRERLIVVALDGSRAIRRIDGDNLRFRCRRGARGAADLVGHGGGGIRIDDENAHVIGPSVRRSDRSNPWITSCQPFQPLPAVRPMPRVYSIPLPASDPWRRWRACKTRITTSAQKITRNDTPLVMVPSA